MWDPGEHLHLISWAAFPTLLSLPAWWPPGLGLAAYMWWQVPGGTPRHTWGHQPTEDWWKRTNRWAEDEQRTNGRAFWSCLQRWGGLWALQLSVCGPLTWTLISTNENWSLETCFVHGHLQSEGVQGSSPHLSCPTTSTWHLLKIPLCRAGGDRSLPMSSGGINKAYKMHKG